MIKLYSSMSTTPKKNRGLASKIHSVFQMVHEVFIMCTYPYPLPGTDKRSIVYPLW